MERNGDWDYGVYAQSPGWIKVAGSRSNGFIDVRVWVYRSQLISLSEETMRPQLMCCALSNPSSSQFRMEVRVSGDNRPEGQVSRASLFLGKDFG